MQTDKNTNLQQLKEILKNFRDKREWKQFHNPKDLAEAITVEAGELQELFLWKDKNEIIKQIKNDKKFKEKVGKELADVIIFCLNFANSTDLDVSKIILNKIKESNKKYPIRKAKGVATKYNEF